MEIEETLTKENFWNQIYIDYPKACKLFCNWIDEYKKAVDWNDLFNDDITNLADGYKVPKFHEIPHAMQQGIWIEFVNQNLDNYFEQPEYSYCLDLREDIKIVFSEIEPLID